MQAQFKCSGRGGRPQADISLQLLRSLTQSYGGAAKIATLLGFHPWTIRHYQLRWGLVSAGLAPRQLDFIDESGCAHYHHHSSLPTMSSLTDEQLDHVMAEILRNYPNHGHSLIDGAIVSRGLCVSRDRIDASRLCVHGPPPPFHRRNIARTNYSVPGPNSQWHHDGNHSKCWSRGRRLPYSQP